MTEDKRRGFVQLHMLFAMGPANLNSNELGEPKSAWFPGSMRGRISSQALKRAWRTSEVFKRILHGRIGSRTRRLGDKIEKHLLEHGMDAEKARVNARAIASAVGKVQPEGCDTPTFTEQLVFLSDDEFARAYALADRTLGGEEIGTPEPSEILGHGAQAADIALFGRMLADPAMKPFEVDGAAKVAHAVTTNTARGQDDYLTAVDDLVEPGSGEARAAFLDVAQFNVGVYYVYTCLNLDELGANLSGSEDAIRATIEAWVRAATTTMPSGKQRSYGSYAKASYVMCEKGVASPMPLTGALFRPIRGEDPVGDSIRAIEDWQARHDRMYGTEDVQRCVTMGDEGETEGLSGIVEFALS